MGAIIKPQTFKKAIEILNGSHLDYTTEQIESIVKSLYDLAEVEYSVLSKKNK